MTESATAVQVPGLHVRKTHYGSWEVIHDATGLAASPAAVRLRRHAEAMLADLGATGVDWTAVKRGEVRNDPAWPAVCSVLSIWQKRAYSDTHDPVTGEYYNDHVYVGSCQVPLVPGVACPRCGPQRKD